MTIETVDHQIPVSVIVSRLEKHRDEIMREIDRTPWWRRRRLAMLWGAWGAYAYEIEQVTEISAGWQPFWRKLRA